MEWALDSLWSSGTLQHWAHQSLEYQWSFSSGMGYSRLQNWSIPVIRWTGFDGGPLRLEKGSGLNNYEGMDWMDIRLSEARYILITAINNFEGSACFGLAEVAWSAEKTVITNNEDRHTEGIFEATISPNPAHQYFYCGNQHDPVEEIRYSCSDLLGRELRHNLQQYKVF